ncbi:MAG: hypothetical protein RLZZ385_798 [Pseudomonadota bacterium]|jgi:geranylgeranyl pyrophosphate synthase
MNSSVTPSLADFFKLCQQRVETRLALELDRIDGTPDTLRQAMTYATLNGGKRVRPLLVYGGALAVGGSLESADTAACAVELLHCYSLVHDDLPAMDNDDLRRGRPTVHKAYDDATAILVGDALQSLAFTVLSDSDTSTVAPAVKLRMVQILARAAGAQGMVGGQMLDFAAMGASLDLSRLEAMHRLKTGALICASVALGGLSGGESTPQRLQDLQTYGELVGLAFQVQDDILDVTADTQTLGKPQGSDQNKNKPTYTSLLGLDTAREHARQLASQAVAALDGFPPQADLLRKLAAYIVERVH